MRNLKKLVFGAAMALSVPVSVFAQRPGALEIGGFGRYTKYADTLRIDAGKGGGGRAGVYVMRNLMAEMDISYSQADVNKLPFARSAAWESCVVAGLGWLNGALANTDHGRLGARHGANRWG